MVTQKQNDKITDLCLILDDAVQDLKGTDNHYLNQVVKSLLTCLNDIRDLAAEEDAKHEHLNQFSLSDEIDIGTRLELADRQVDWMYGIMGTDLI